MKSTNLVVPPVAERWLSGFEGKLQYDQQNQWEENFFESKSPVGSSFRRMQLEFDTTSNNLRIIMRNGRCIEFFESFKVKSCEDKGLIHKLADRSF